MKYFLVFSLWLNSYSLTLEEGFSYLSESEKIKIALISYERALNNQEALKSNIFPTITLNSTYTKTHYNEAASLDDLTSKTLAINLTQPLFRGLREFNALEASKFISQSKNYSKDFLLRDLKSQFVSQYFSLLTLEKDSKLTKRLLEASEKRLKEIEGRVKIGKSKKADLYQARSQVFVVQSSLSEVISKIEMGYVNILDLISKNSLVKSISEPKYIALKSDNSKTLNHPILKNIELLKEVARLELKSSKAGHLPTLDLKGNYYLGGENFNQDKNWDASLNLSIPIYSGGGINSDVTDKSLVINEIEHTYIFEKRALESKIQNLVVDFETGANRLEFLKNATDALKISYEEIQKEYNLGLVTTLDVIQSLNQYIDSEKTYFKTFYQTQSAAYIYKIMMENSL